MNNKESAVVLDLELDDTAKNILDGQSKICNWLYNHLLDIANNLKSDYIETKDPDLALTIYSKTGLRNLVPDIAKS